MIRFVEGPAGRPSRREWLRLGSLAGLGMIGGASRSSATPRLPGFGRAKSVIIVYANGGQSQLDTWDPKPDAPLEVRGEFGTIATSTPGVRVGELLPRLAGSLRLCTLVRTVSHDDLDHGSATYLALTGRFHPRKSANPPPSPNDYPTLAALLRRARPSVARLPFGAAHVNGPALVPELPGPGQDGGFLGRSFDPLVVGDVTLGPSSRPSLSLPEGVSPARAAARRSLRRSLDAARTHLEGSPRLDDLDALYRNAYAILDDPRAREAFDLESEPDRVRERYGRFRAGQSCLLARRLAEAGVPLVTVFWNHSARGQDTRAGDLDAYGWDAHNDVFQVYRELLPRFDQSVSALLEDLEGRGMLDQTLVLITGEFGRAPRVALEPKFDGASPGRKHWAGAYSVVFAGAGVSRGAVLGASDRFGAYPSTEPVGPWDLAATVFWALGIDPSTELRDPLDRPFPITLGRPIAGLYQG
ncbi:MAG: DUF1501 domain-containing protein [Isosphaeraceae bacterium]